MRREFCRSNPWAGDPCQRNDCLVCAQEGGGDCRKRNILYKTTCVQCKGTDKEASYIGESARSGYERGRDHQEDYEKMEFDSHMLMHQILSHGELQEKLTFSMKILKVHTSAFMRQVHEAVAIEMNEKNNILNSKGGYNRCKLPRLAIKMGQAEVRDGEKVEVMNETEIEKEIERLRREKKVRKKKEKDLDENQEPPRKKKRKWNIETGKKRKKPEKEIFEEGGPNDRKKIKLKSHEISINIENENLQEYSKNKSMKISEKSENSDKDSQRCRPQHFDMTESSIDMCSENLKTNKIPKTIHYFFENLRKKNCTPGIEENFIQPTFSLKSASQVLKKGEGVRKSENKANTAHSSSLSTHHQIKKRKNVKQPCYNYKPINQFFTPQGPKTAGNSNPVELKNLKNSD